MLYILDPLASKQHLNGWDVSPLYIIDPWPLTPLHSWPFPLKTASEWMRWLSIVHYWPLTIKAFTFLTLYPENSMWMDGMTLFIARSWPLTLNPFIILREQSIILYHTTVPKFVRYQNRSTSPSGNYVHLQSHFDRYLTKEGTDISIVQQTGPLKMNLSGWDDSSLNVIDPPHSTLEICAGNNRPI